MEGPVANVHDALAAVMPSAVDDMWGDACIPDVITYLCKNRSLQLNDDLRAGIVRAMRASP